jgi:hypothetical protein
MTLLVVDQLPVLAREKSAVESFFKVLHFPIRLFLIFVFATVLTVFWVRLCTQRYFWILSFRGRWLGSVSRSKVELLEYMTIVWPSPSCVEGHQSQTVILFVCFRDCHGRYIETCSTDCAHSLSANYNNAYLTNYFLRTFLHGVKTTLIYVEYLVRCKPKFCDIAFRQIEINITLFLSDFFA